LPPEKATPPFLGMVDRKGNAEPRVLFAPPHPPPPQLHSPQPFPGGRFWFSPGGADPPVSRGVCLPFLGLGVPPRIARRAPPPPRSPRGPPPPLGAQWNAPPTPKRPPPPPFDPLGPDRGGNPPRPPVFPGPRPPHPKTPWGPQGQKREPKRNLTPGPSACSPDREKSISGFPPPGQAPPPPPRTGSREVPTCGPDDPQSKTIPLRFGCPKNHWPPLPKKHLRPLPPPIPTKRKKLRPPSFLPNFQRSLEDGWEPKLGPQPVGPFPAHVGRPRFFNPVLGLSPFVPGSPPDFPPPNCPPPFPFRKDRGCPRPPPSLDPGWAPERPSFRQSPPFFFPKLWPVWTAPPPSPLRFWPPWFFFFFCTPPGFFPPPPGGLG